VNAMGIRMVPWVGCVVFLGFFLSRASAFQTPQYLDNLPVDHAAIQYNAIEYKEGALLDPVTRLIRQVESGKIELPYRPGRLGFLPGLLAKLGIPTDSQALAFAKGSFQAAKISPRNPRAIYFTDDAEVGYVPGGDEIEIVGIDPRQGAVFYTLEADAQNRPVFKRQTVCLNCHQGAATLGVPGIFIASTYPSVSGMPSPNGGAVTDHRTRFEDRWGGWYVSGTHGAQRHRGNAVAPDPAEPEVLETEGTQNLKNLSVKFNPAPYLTPDSDIVALMTLEHQTQITNLFTRVGWEARIATSGGKTDPAALAKLESGIAEIAAYMLFADEALLTAPVTGVSTFTTTFRARGPRDRKGRSLRDFDLQKRLFRYPLSYMIYSAAFDALPDAVRAGVYRRLHDVLTGQDRSPRFARLTQPERQVILEILRDTKPGLPDYWKAGARL
jgi:hypothetical protein